MAFLQSTVGVPDVDPPRSAWTMIWRHSGPNGTVSYTWRQIKYDIMPCSLDIDKEPFPQIV